MANNLDDRVVYINRVSKAMTGGSTFSFSTMVAVGDENGRVGVGIGNAGEVPASIEKGRKNAEDQMIKVPILGSTIPHEIETEHDSARVLLKPASPGTGIIAGGAVRNVVELAGINNILAKSLGSDNPLNIVRATMKGLKNLKDPHRVAQLRGISLERLLEENPFAGPEDLPAEQRQELAEEKAKEEEESEESDESTPEEASDEDAESEDASDEEEAAPEEEAAAVEST